MSSLTTLLRRTLWLVVLAGLGGALYSWLRARSQPAPSSAPVWPPLDTAASTRVSSTSGAATAGGASESGAPAPGGQVNPVVDTADSRPSGNGDATWVAPNDDGTCPVTHPIKANENSGIFHVPGGQFYDRTGPERCYSSAEAAAADGYRQAKA